MATIETKSEIAKKDDAVWYRQSGGYHSETATPERECERRLSNYREKKLNAMKQRQKEVNDLKPLRQTLQTDT